MCMDTKPRTRRYPEMVSRKFTDPTNAYELPYEFYNGLVSISTYAAMWNELGRSLPISADFVRTLEANTDFVRALEASRARRA